MNLSDFKNRTKDSHLTEKELQSVVGGDTGIIALIGASTGWNLLAASVNQQTTTNPLGAAAMLSDSQVYFTVTGTSNGLGVHESAHLVSIKNGSKP